MKKRAVAAIVCVAGIVGALAATAVAQSQRFPDVPPDHYAFEAVEWAAEVGVTTGYTDGTFKPERPLIKRHAVVFMERYYDEILQAEQSDDFTRGDMMVLLKAINDGTIGDTEPDTGAESPAEDGASQRFPDVPPDHYAFEAVEWAAEVGVTTGYTDGTFKPERPLIKRHAVVFMERYYDEILQAEQSDDFTRGDMMVLLKAINDGTAGVATPTMQLSLTPGEGETITMARANWPGAYFQAQIYKQTLEELGYDVTEPSELELNQSLAYLAMAEGEFDFWVNSWYPWDLAWWAFQLADLSRVGDRLTIVGNEMMAPSGLLITKSFADEHGVTHLDQINDDPAILAAFDVADHDPGNGVADIFGCPEAWNCDNIINSQIAFSGWENIAQVTADYGTMFAEAVAKVAAGDPMVAYTWTPTTHITQLRPGDNVYWLAVEDVIDDSNPTGIQGGEGHDQRPGTADIAAESCPAAADAGTCQLGWVVTDIQVTANTEWLNATPYAAELLCAVTLPVIDVSLASSEQANAGDAATEVFIAGLASDWIANNRDTVDGWLDRARMAPAEPACPDTAIPPSLLFSAVSVGDYFSCGLRGNGAVDCWGDNFSGRTDAPDETFGAVDAGPFHSCGLRTDGTITCWGSNNDHDGNYRGQADPPEGTFSAVATGLWHTCGLRPSGTVTCWGDNTYGQTDVSSRTFSAVASGSWHTCGLRPRGTVTCWGNNTSGQTDVPRGTYTAVDAGDLHTCGLRTDGTITCWGSNNDHDGSHLGQAEAPAGTFSAVNVGALTSCGLSTDGTITCWGDNSLGQANPPDGTFISVSMGYSHGCGLRPNGTMTCWGRSPLRFS